jgi:alpha-galactosidase
LIGANTIRLPDVISSGKGILVFHTGRLVCQSELEWTEDSLIFHTSITNPTNQDIVPGDVFPIGNIMIDCGDLFDKVHTVCRDLLGFCGPQSFDREWDSYGVFGLTDDKGTQAVVAGYEDAAHFTAHFLVKREDGSLFIRPVLPFEHKTITAGQTVRFPDLRITAGRSLIHLMEAFAVKLSEAMGGPPSLPPIRSSGFCSWYSHYGTECWADLEQLLDSYAASPLGKHLEYFLIDGGWNEDAGDLQFIWGDWEAGNKFPQGMKAVSDAIKRRGFKSGLWVAPFAVTRNSSIYRDHPDWLIAEGRDLLNTGGQTFGLDLTLPAVKAYLRETITKIFDVWGYDYIKIDFLLFGAMPGERSDNEKTAAEAFREGLRVIRECAGGRLVLNCGSPLLPSVGLCEAMRIGADVGSQWYFPLNEGAWQYGNCCVKAGMRYILHNHWMHRRFWQNDPDCLVARSHSNGIEYRQFRHWFKDMDIREASFGLTRNEFLAFGKLVWFTGSLFFLSDDPEGLEQERWELLLRFSEPNPQEVETVDWYGSFDVTLMKTKQGPLKIGVFNIGEQTEIIRVPLEKFSEFQLPSGEFQSERVHFREMTEPLELSVEEGFLVFPPIPARTGYVFEAFQICENNEAPHVFIN